MADPFIAEIRIVSFGFAPRGWALCDGQVLQSAQNPSLYALIGNAFGGTPPTTFALPDFRGRAPMHVEAGRVVVGQRGGEEAHALTPGEMPPHTHQAFAQSAPGTTSLPTGNFLAAANVAPYRTDVNTSFAPAFVSTIGGSLAHENRQPFLVLTFVIALEGTVPPHS